MADMTENPAVKGVLVAAILISLIFAIKALLPNSAPAVDWVCDACEYRFTDEVGPSPQKCPKCKEMEAVRTQWYRCGNCGEDFEPFRTKYVMIPPEEFDGIGEPGVGYVKLPGGEWIKDKTPEATEMRHHFKCPHCGNADHDNMEFLPAGE